MPGVCSGSILSGAFYPYLKNWGLAPSNVSNFEEGLMIRKNKWIIVGAVLSAVTLFLFSPSLAVDMSEGKWEHTVEVKMEGMPGAPVMPLTTTQCMTQKDLVPCERNCTIDEEKITGNKIVWKKKCIEKSSVTESEGEITYNGTTYSGTMKTKITEKRGQVINSTMKMKGRRIGDCN
jgi:hypothetical protein